ncbi:chemotaxis protein CheB [Acidovorax sp. LjRoot194]|uniref:chemotaxis protein CheB n=1 Tax=Acidovorax sp. LjRoot194 TaxID=3342280 RepID=UPI003ED031F6
MSAATAPGTSSSSASGSSFAYEAIVVGGSSGGVEALVALLPALPATLQAAMVVVLHLPRDRRSLLADIFRQRCALPMQEAGDKDRIEAGTVYFAPPDYHLLVDDGPRLSLSVDAPVHFSRPSIDVLFESAADLYGPRLVGILLSGANEDGAQGLAAIRSAGGLAIVQDPASAPMPTMPLAALARTPVDHTLPPAGIAALLAQLHQQSLL